MQRLIEELRRLPGIGEKTATRLAFHVLHADHSFAANLAQALLSLKEQSRLCSLCFGLTEQDPCTICADPRRKADEVCVVEDPADLLALERAQEYRGHYHVLGGALAPLDGVGPEHLRCTELVERVRGGRIREVIVATNPTAEGEATALYVARLVKPLGVRVTRIARGLPMGGDVEYTDVVTLGKSLEGRREM
ncbi:MAG TPA: recombination mediator RecR [Candidatus Bathyarchaeia archaeon]|nr:recombination mediator RecR [Candidatus Bathyarchaeia archaeon]